MQGKAWNPCGAIHFEQHLYTLNAPDCCNLQVFALWLRFIVKNVQRLLKYADSPCKMCSYKVLGVDICRDFFQPERG